MQFDHEVRLIPLTIIRGRGGEDAYITLDTRMIYLENAHGANAAMVEFKEATKTYRVIGCMNVVDPRYNVKLVPQGYIIVKPGPRYLYKYNPHRIWQHSGRVDISDRLYFIPVGLIERIPMVYEDTGEVVHVARVDEPDEHFHDELAAAINV